MQVPVLGGKIPGERMANPSVFFPGISMDRSLVVHHSHWVTKLDRTSDYACVQKLVEIKIRLESIYDA